MSGVSREIIFEDDELAAKYVENIKGWVSRDGFFYGTDETAARYRGATHGRCKECGATIDKFGSLCQSCRDAHDQLTYNKAQTGPWKDGPIFSDFEGEYYWDIEDLEDSLEEGEEISKEKLRLYLCRPIYADPIDPYAHYYDCLSDEAELPGEIVDAFEELNEKLEACNKVPLSWEPTNVAWNGEYEVKG